MEDIEQNCAGETFQLTCDIFIDKPMLNDEKLLPGDKTSDSVNLIPPGTSISNKWIYQKKKSKYKVMHFHFFITFYYSMCVLANINFVTSNSKVKVA